MSALFYVATYNGFLVIEPVPGGRDRVYTDSNVRYATPFSSFRQAEAAGKWGVGRLFPKDKSYFAVMQVTQGAALASDEAMQELVGQDIQHAEAYAGTYDGDDCKFDVLNAFYAGIHYERQRTNNDQ